MSSDQGPRKVGYLGPAGTFTHQAALKFAEQCRGFETRPREDRGERSSTDGTPPEPSPCAQSQGLGDSATKLVPYDSVGQVFTALENGDVDYGVAALDNTVEGPVFATIDGLLSHPDIVASSGGWLPIQFDAYALLGSTTGNAGNDGSNVANRDNLLPLGDIGFEFGVAHPHALAQVAGYLKQHNLKLLAAASNGAALENLQPGQVAFGPPGYLAPGVITIARNVGDYADAETQFVLLEARNQVNNESATSTMLAITPRDTGPGVLARITAEFAKRRLNLSALFSRPIKGVAKQYVFIVTVDVGPGSAKLQELLSALAAENDALKILGSW